MMPIILATRRKTNRNHLLGPKRGVPIILATRRKSKACKAASFASSIWGSTTARHFIRASATVRRQGGFPAAVFPISFSQISWALAGRSSS